MSVAHLVSTGILFVIAGSFAGLMSGVLGIGGGIVVVPALVYIFRDDPAIPQNLVMQIAAGTSLAVMMFTSLASLRAHFIRSKIEWRIYQRLWPGVVAGVLSGALLAGYLPTAWLKVLLGLFLLFVAIKMLSGMNTTTAHGFPRGWINGCISFLIGLKSGLLGIGGGALIIPYLSYCGVPMYKIAPVSALCTMTVAFLGTIVFMFTGWNEAALPSFSMGFVYWPAVAVMFIPSMFFAPLGAALTYRLPVKQLTYGFIVILILTAFNLLFF